MDGKVGSGSLKPHAYVFATIRNGTAVYSFLTFRPEKGSCGIDRWGPFWSGPPPVHNGDSLLLVSAVDFTGNNYCTRLARTPCLSFFTILNFRRGPRPRLPSVWQHIMVVCVSV